MLHSLHFVYCSHSSGINGLFPFQCLKNFYYLFNRRDDGPLALVFIVIGLFAFKSIDNE